MANLHLIKVLARKKNLTLKEVAEQLGITQQALSLLIRTGTTRIDTLERIAELLDVSPAIFFEDGHAQSAVAQEHSIAVGGSNNKVNGQADGYIELLKKKDEQIDRLLTIIEKLK